MKNIIVIGASGHAKVILDIVEKQGKYSVAGLLDREKAVGTEFFGYPVLGKEEDLPGLVKEKSIEAGIIAIGDNWTRSLAVQKILSLAPDFKFVSAVHPSAQIAKGVKLGKGTVVMANAAINSDSKIGDFCIVNTSASLDHDCLMEDYSSLAPNVATGGNVTIGKFSAICIGASLSHGISIGEHCVVGAVGFVQDDVPAYSVFHGVPARFIRKREKGEKYLKTP